jgi:signal transduction histidine kinase/CheY-like chemotaxis protein
MVVDAAQRSKNAVPPPVRVESVQVDGEAISLSTGPELEVGRGRISFQFAVFSYRNPEAVRARYRLEGYEEKWQESPADRAAEYTNLPPGHYQFHVIAANEDGVWNEAGATAAIVVPPTLVERVSFRVALALLIGALIFFWFRSREANLKAREALVASLVGQRTAELERAKNAAEQATRARTEFLANISHEIRTPLNAVIGATDLVRQTALTFEQREYLDIINSSGEGLLSLLNDVLDLSKIEAGHMKVNAAPVDVRLVCQRVLDSLSASVRAKPLRLEFDCATDVPAWVLSDETRLRQVMLNLVGNALKFTSKGFVRVTVRAHAVERLRFEVEDSGIGLSAEQRGRLFQAFSQADASTSRRYGGTGLGLVISERLVNLMGGSIGVDSVVGEGSRFWFEVTAPEAEAPPEVALEANLALPSLQVLLVDDSPINLRVTSDLLRRLGMSVTAANSGPEALTFASGQHFQLVLMDLQMPDMDGLETTRLLNEQVKPPPLVVALTANAIEEDRRRCLQLGMRDYLTKPVRLDALTRVIRLAAEAQHLVRPPALR